MLIRPQVDGAGGGGAHAHVLAPVVPRLSGFIRAYRPPIQRVWDLLRVSSDDLSATASQRIGLIDSSRGLFVVWMVIGHALTLAGVPADHPLQLLRPTGWATTCFVMLTGFSIATVFAWSEGKGEALRRKLWHRAREIALVALVSNRVFTLSAAALAGNLSPRLAVDAVTFRVPWSISAILIPTTGVLLAAPGLLRLGARIGRTAFFAATTVVAAGVDLIAVLAPQSIRGAALFQNLMTTEGLFCFPILPFFLYSCWSLSFATLVKGSARPTAAWLAVIVGWLALRASAGAAGIEPSAGLAFVDAAGRFAAAVWIVLLVCRLELPFGLERQLAVFGRSALLVFVLHRPVLQAQTLVLGESLGTVWIALVLLTVTAAVSFALASARERSPRLSVALKTAGF